MFFHQWESFHALSGRPTGQISCHSVGSWMVFVLFEFSHALSGYHSGRIFYNSGGSWMVFHQCNPALFLKWNDWLNRITSLLNLTQFIDWIIDLSGKYINAREQQILIKMGTTKCHRISGFFVHYWGLLLNKNCREAGFCPLLGAFPQLGSALLGEYSVIICRGEWKNSKILN